MREATDYKTKLIYKEQHEKHTIHCKGGVQK